MSNSLPWLVLAILTSVACTKELTPVKTSADCIPLVKLTLSKKKRAVIKTALLTRIDTRRMKFNENRFCAYTIPTTNKDFSVLKIYQPNISHVSQTWILVSKLQAVDTKLNRYQMVTDTLETQRLINQSVISLTGANQSLQQELIELLSKEARFYNKQGDLSGTRK